LGVKAGVAGAMAGAAAKEGALSAAAQRRDVRRAVNREWPRVAGLSRIHSLALAATTETVSVPGQGFIRVG
jgi:hypothetical protein